MTQKMLAQGVTRRLRAGLAGGGLRRVAVYAAATPLVVSAMSACGDTINNDFNSYYQDAHGGETSGDPGGGRGGEPPTTDGGEPNVAGGGDRGGGGGDGSGGAPRGDGGGAGDAVGPAGAGGLDEAHAMYPDAPYADTAVAEQQLDPFGTIGTKFWFGVSDEQVALMNQGDQGGGNGGDIYTPGGSSQGPYVDYLWVSAPGEDGQIADYGKVKVKVVGQSTNRPWTKTTIPNLNIDSNDFVKGQLIGGYEHLRLNNGQVGSIFREWLSLTLYTKLNYPAPHVSFAWAGGNVWGPGVEIPMVLVERYKRKFCERFPEFGGKCNNMWEFWGDFAQGGGFPMKGGGGGGFSIFDQDICQFDECEPTRAKELEALVGQTPEGDGYKAALADYLDWPAFHRFQCLSWVLATGDDALHNNNNVVLAEGADGKFRYLPYSTDISLGQDWYPEVSLPGTNSISRGCQSETSCWADTIAACEDVVAEFQALDPVSVLEDLHDTLDDAGMLRRGDEGRYAILRAWFQERLVALPEELEQYRDNPDQTFCRLPEVDCGGYCDYPQNCGGMNCGINQVDCGGYCDYPENCGPVCVPPVGPMAAAAADVGAGGAAGQGGGAGGGGPICPKIMTYAVEP